MPERENSMRPASSSEERKTAGISTTNHTNEETIEREYERRERGARDEKSKNGRTSKTLQPPWHEFLSASSAKRLEFTHRTAKEKKGSSP